MPEDAKLLGLWLDRNPQPSSSAARELTVNLDPSQKFSTIAVQFMTSSPAWGNWRRWSAPVVEIDLPILARHETLWLPASYQALNYGAAGAAGYPSQQNWTDRLFGPLARPAESGTVRPFAG